MKKNDLFDNYKIASEYHQAAFCTFGNESSYERKFRYKLFKVMRKIRRIDRNFKFAPTSEMLKIDYSLFGYNIDHLIRMDFDLLNAEEFNFVSHHCSAGMFLLSGTNDIELGHYKDHYLLMHDSDYISVRRIALINDIINDLLF
jgi:hypothetical protein